MAHWHHPRQAKRGCGQVWAQQGGAPPEHIWNKFGTHLEHLEHLEQIWNKSGTSGTWCMAKNRAKFCPRGKSAVRNFSKMTTIFGAWREKKVIFCFRGKNAIKKTQFFACGGPKLTIWNKSGTNLEQIWNKSGTNLEQIWNVWNVWNIWNALVPMVGCSQRPWCCSVFCFLCFFTTGAKRSWSPHHPAPWCLQQAHLG